MLQAARDAAAIVSGITRESFRSDRMRMLALERSMELIGEAAGRVSEALRKKHPQLPWKEMIGLRNILLEWTGLPRAAVEVTCVLAGLGLLALGLRAVWILS